MNKEALTEQNVLDMLDAAGYGIAYWADQATIDTDARTYTVRVADSPESEEETFVARFDEIKEAYFQLVDLDQGYVAKWVHKYFLDSYIERDELDGIDAGHIDGTAADVLVQVALWGEVVYG